MPFKKGRKVGSGGRRKGAGRKPSAYTRLKRRLQETKIADAEEAFDLYVRIMHNPKEPTALRMAAADRIQDRVLGKAKESILHSVDQDQNTIDIVVHDGKPKGE